MNTTEFIQAATNELHRVMMDDVKVLKQEQVVWKPAPKANPIGFLFWHFMRTEDNAIQRLQEKPSIWENEGWYQKLGMDAKAQGTGFQEPEVDRAARLPLAELLTYAERVISSTDSYLKSLDDSKLDFRPDANRPQWNVARTIRNMIVAHGWWHLGEIKYLKGLQGISAP